MAKPPRYKRLWLRLIITTVALLLITFCVGLIIWGSNSSNTDIALGLLAGISALVVVGQWVFPFPSEKPQQLILPYARELVRNSASFRMGDTIAANFDYIIEPIKNAYETARQTLHEASTDVGSKRGILILGIANAGKTRLAFETLTQTLPNWKFLLWNAAYDTPAKIPALTVSRGSGLVVFIDDLQEYVPAEGYDADIHGFISDNRIATLQAFLHTMQTTEHLVVVTTCRLEDETRVGARLRWLFDQLKVIALPSFSVEATDPRSANIIDLFQQHGATHVEDWDGTLGSLVLGLSKKRSQYEGLVQARSPAVTVLRAMKLLSLALITVHTNARIQGVCTGVFRESTLREDSKTWQESVDHLKRYEEALVAYDQAIRLDPNLASAYNTKGVVLLILQRYEEALATFEQTIRLDPSLAYAYNNKGVALRNLQRYEEALAAYEQAIRLDPTGAAAYNGKGGALSKLQRYEEALAAYEQAIRLDPNDASAYNGKGLALADLQRYEEALVAYEQAIRLDPYYAAAYDNKGLALRNLKRHEEALVAFEQVIRLDPTMLMLIYVY